MPLTTAKLTWHALHDGHRICPICLELDNYTWVYTLGATELSDTLMHPKFGPVWNMSAGSNVHGYHHMQGTCHCSVTYELDFKDLLERVKSLHATVSASFNIPAEGKAT